MVTICVCHSRNFNLAEFETPPGKILISTPRDSNGTFYQVSSGRKSNRVVEIPTGRNSNWSFYQWNFKLENCLQTQRLFLHGKNKASQKEKNSLLTAEPKYRKVILCGAEPWKFENAKWPPFFAKTNFFWNLGGDLANVPWGSKNFD